MRTFTINNLPFRMSDDGRSVYEERGGCVFYNHERDGWVKHIHPPNYDHRYSRTVKATDEEIEILERVAAQPVE